MNQEDRNVQQTNSNVQQTTSSQTQREILDYWTPERMQNAKPLMPKVPDDPSSVPYPHVKEPSSPSISTPGSDIKEKSSAIPEGSIGNPKP